MNDYIDPATAILIGLGLTVLWAKIRAWQNREGK